MPARLRFIAQDFARDERGAVAILFGFMLLALVMSVGVAVDYARATHSKSRITAAADAAALAAGRALMDGTMSDDEIAQFGARYFNANLTHGDEFSRVSNVRVIPNRADNSIEVQVDADVPMTFMRVAGFEDVDTSTGTVTTFQASDLELGLALDITGSMCNGSRSPCTAGRKLDALKTAAKDLFDTLLLEAERPNKVRIGLAPYSASVQLGGYAAAASGNSSTDGCVRERAGSSAYTDDSIEDGGAFQGAGSFTDIDPTQGLQGYSCPSSAVVPLTSDKDVLRTAVDGFRAQGSTAGHIGAQWAWNLISPNFSSLWPEASEPVAYSDPKTTKAVILMTDGIFNMAYDNDQSAAQALSICDGLGEKGVQVHTVAFESPASAKELLQDCAERAGGVFHEAENADDLRTAFVSIARSLNDLRLTQ